MNKAIQKKHRPLSWKACRRGEIYCAPACGFECTWSDYQQAKRNAAKLCIRLDTAFKVKGWKPHVWENLGWHYSAISSCGRIKVHPCHHGSRILSYTAFLNAVNAFGGRWAEQGNTPDKAVRNVLKVANAEIGCLLSIVRGL